MNSNSVRNFEKLEGSTHQCFAACFFGVIIRPQLVKRKLFFQKSQPQSGIVFFDPSTSMTASAPQHTTLWNTQKTAQIYNRISVLFHTMTRPDLLRGGTTGVSNAASKPIAVYTLCRSECSDSGGGGGVGVAQQAAAPAPAPSSALPPTTLAAAAAPPASPPNLRRWPQRRGNALPLHAAQYQPTIVQTSKNVGHIVLVCKITR